MDDYRDTAVEFYKDLQAGKADQKDFERYIYGQHGAKSYNKDDKDEDNESQYREQKQIENEFKGYVSAAQSKK